MSQITIAQNVPLKTIGHGDCPAVADTVLIKICGRGIDNGQLVSVVGCEELRKQAINSDELNCPILRNGNECPYPVG